MWRRSSETSNKTLVNRIPRGDPARGLKRGDLLKSIPSLPKRVERHFNRQAERIGNGIMGRKKESLQHALLARVLPEIENNATGRSYKKHIKSFVRWAKENGHKRPEDITKDVIQEYEEYLEKDPRQYSAATIHSYITPVCRAAGVSMGLIRKPRRTAGTITRGRDYDAAGLPLAQNARGRKEEDNPKFARLMTLQKAVGIRRAELGRLYGADLVSEGESLFVRVRKGKGGKSQLQYILPKDRKAVLEVFDGVAPDQKVFSRDEMSNKINLHGIRAQHGRECYQHYLSIITARPEAADRLRATLLQRWDKGHERLRESDPRAWERQRRRFIKDCDDRPYLIRGENLRKAQALGLPDTYNRLALMCVSVFHLSHWRLDVTVVNYML